VGGFLGPYLIGRVKERTGEFTPGLLLLAGFLVAAVVVVAGLRAAGRPAGAASGTASP
jgi:ACS family tartrate transporter-like MFS transporter